MANGGSYYPLRCREQQRTAERAGRRIAKPAVVEVHGLPAGGRVAGRGVDQDRDRQATLALAAFEEIRPGARRPVSVGFVALLVPPLLLGGVFVEERLAGRLPPELPTRPWPQQPPACRIPAVDRRQEAVVVLRAAQLLVAVQSNSCLCHRTGGGLPQSGSYDPGLVSQLRRHRRRRVVCAQRAAAVLPAAAVGARRWAPGVPGSPQGKAVS